MSKTGKSQIAVVETTPARDPGFDDEAVEVGQWYWVKDDDDPGETWLGCVVHVGTNYAELEGVGWNRRVHFDEFQGACTSAPRAEEHIEAMVSQHRAEVDRLLGRVRELTARLGVAPSPGLPAPGSETRALATVGHGQDMGEYKSALVKARGEDLPDLFNRIERENAAMASWMTAKLIPLKAQAAGMKKSVSIIEERIFSVELYAGLTEQVAAVAEGDPAPLGERVRLLQRRHYMDEECLAQYRTGGMDFQGIRAFDRWIAEPENRDRLLPFPRCIVSFRVRRDRKERAAVSLSDFISFIGFEEADKKTFLYIRNGDQVFRMSTALDFGPRLFPDPDRSRLSSGQKLWARQSGSRVDPEGIITDDEYQAILAEHRDAVKEYRAEKAKTPKKDRWRLSEPRMWDTYVPFVPSSVYFDDIANVVGDQLKQHNRIALIIQGLLDRSPVLHPHPPWQIWTKDGFESALELIYDESRALVAGERPDFEAYRRRLNESLADGSVTVGQEDAWELREGEKESRRMDDDHRTRAEWRPERFRPYGNPGPGTLARVFKHVKSGRSTFAWNRQRQTAACDGDSTEIRTTFTCPDDVLLNVDAYKPGDFRAFFDDPRTRAEYLGWAPFLLEAEEYHAGNRDVPDPPLPSHPKESSWEGRKRYAQRRLRKQLTGKAVRLSLDVTMKNNHVYKNGTLWRIIGGSGADFYVTGIEVDGSVSKDYRSINGLSKSDFEVDDSIPAEPKEEVKNGDL